MKNEIHLARRRIARGGFSGTRTSLLIVATLLACLAMLVAPGCVHNTSSPPPSQAPGQRGEGGGW
jgi:hypothetical protein